MVLAFWQLKMWVSLRGEVFMTNSSKSLEKIVNLCKNRGFIFSGSEIYGGLANTWDYGPLGVELKNNLKKAWWNRFIRENEHNVGLDCSILMNPAVWVASGHVSGFSDLLTDCRECKQRFRADHLIEGAGLVFDFNMNSDELYNIIESNKIKCPNCGSCNFTEIRSFNLMFKTFQGVAENKTSELFLRPETAQGIFVNFANVQRTTRKKLPFGIGQIGKSFRNEITPGNFIFRTREFEQMELEFFCEPGADLDWFDYWKNFCMDFFVSLKINRTSLRFRDHTKQELAHYSKATTDVEFEFPFGWGELCGVAHRGNFDLACHQNASKKILEYFDPKTGEKFLPLCIEPSMGVDRTILALLCDAYAEEVVNSQSGEVRTVLKLSPELAPVKVCVLPLTKKLSESAFKIFKKLSRFFAAEFDDVGSIGKRYRRQDEIGTPFCVTFDFDSENDGCVTVRERDSMQQISDQNEMNGKSGRVKSGRVSIERLHEFLAARL